MTVRAKFVCTSMVNDPANNQDAPFRLRFQAVQDMQFGPYTPNADLVMDVVESAARHFEPGKSYFVDFNEAPEE